MEPGSVVRGSDREPAAHGAGGGPGSGDPGAGGPLRRGRRPGMTGQLNSDCRESPRRRAAPNSVVSSSRPDRCRPTVSASSSSISSVTCPASKSWTQLRGGGFVDDATPEPAGPDLERLEPDGTSPTLLSLGLGSATQTGSYRSISTTPLGARCRPHTSSRSRRCRTSRLLTRWLAANTTSKVRPRSSVYRSARTVCAA